MDQKSTVNNLVRKIETVEDDSLKFEITINADVHTVYSVMLDEKYYSEWTSIFNPTSRFEGSWEKGSKILFIGEDQDGGAGGMVSRIKENLRDKIVTIEHYGIFKNGEEIITGPEVEKWAGSIEEYSFKEETGRTILTVEMKGLMEYRSYFEEHWPKALIKLKTMCENLK